VLEAIADPAIWAALAKIAFINVVLSGDNAVVIALACRSLDPKQQRSAFLIGTAGIVVLMTLLTAFAAMLLTLPYLQLGGGVLLVWIGVKLLLPEDEDADIQDNSNFWAAVRTIIVADMVMSLDNVLGMAAAANGHLGLLFVGLLITMPLILFGSAMLMKLMERFPHLVTLGAGVLGYVAGDMLVSDVAVREYVALHAPALETIVPIACALLVVVGGKAIAMRRARVVADAKTAHADDAVPVNRIGIVGRVEEA
jgi:YjbE family integral membrane protein